MFYNLGKSVKQSFVICYGTTNTEEHNYNKGIEKFDNMESADEFLLKNGYKKYGKFYYKTEGSSAYITVRY